MIPTLRYGNETKSSAAVESVFNKIKNIVFKDIKLPMSLETFIERNLVSLNGSSCNNSNTIFYLIINVYFIITFIYFKYNIFFYHICLLFEP